MFDNTPDQMSKFRTKTWIEINDQSIRVYNTSRDITFKTAMLKSGLCDYDDAYILVKRTITITRSGEDATARKADERNKVVIFKNCALFTKCISKINGTEIDSAQDIDIVMSMYNLTEYSYNYRTKSGSLWQYYKDDPNGNLTDSESFKSKVKITGNTPVNGNTKDI